MKLHWSAHRKFRDKPTMQDKKYLLNAAVYLAVFQLQRSTTLSEVRARHITLPLAFSSRATKVYDEYEKNIRSRFMGKNSSF